MNMNDVCIELHNMVKHQIAINLTDITSAVSFTSSGNGVLFFVLFFCITISLTLKTANAM